MKTFLGPGGPSTMVAHVPERVGEREILGLAHLEGVRVRVRADSAYPPMMPKPSLWRRAVAWVTRRAA